MRKLYLLIAFVFILLMFLIFLNYRNSGSESEICISDKCFKVEVADNPIKRAQGLMFRKELNENSGMLFVFPNSGKYSFWMKNTFIPLDIIWIDENLEVVYIYENAQPCSDECDSIIPDKEAKYVLEINARLAEKYGIEIGDVIKLQ